MRRKLLFVVMALSLMLPCIATADIVDPVDFLAIWDANGWTVKINTNGYSDPKWEKTGAGEFDVLALDNIEWPTLKWVWLEVVYCQLPVEVPVVTLRAHYNNPPRTEDFGPDNPRVGENTITWLWVIPQPDEEKYFFPDGSFYNLCGIERIEVATHCIPLPASLGSGLALMGGVLGFARRRR